MESGINYCKRIIKKADHVIHEKLFLKHVGIVSLNGVKAKFHLEGLGSQNEAKFIGREAGFIGDMMSVIQNTPNINILDIGARHGLHTLLLAAKNPSNHIVAVEPDPGNIALLSKNIVLNELDNVVVLPLAIANTDGISNLLTSGSEGKSPRLTTVKNREVDNSKYKQTIPVNTRSLDSLIESNQLEIPDLIKIDIEGAEGLLFRGAEKLFSGKLARKPSHVFIELHRTLIPEPDSPESINQFLIDRGYQLIDEQERGTENLCHYHLTG